jgi:signal peptidase II
MVRWLALAALIVGCDQLSKYVLVPVVAAGAVEITPFFNLVLAHNRGAAFSFLAGASGWQRELFIGIAMAAAVWIIYLLRRHANERLFSAALSLILGGALGNLIDRVHLGAVLDFFDFHLLGYHWPAFNVADSAITIGAALLIWHSLRPAGAASGKPVSGEPKGRER